MFKHIKKKALSKISTETRELLESAPTRDSTGVIFNVPPEQIYIEKVQANDFNIVSYLILSGSVDVNYRIRYNPKMRTDNDFIPLAYAIITYNFRMAELLIELGHTTSDLVVYLNNADKNTMFYESYQKAIEFCNKYGIMWEDSINEQE